MSSPSTAKVCIKCGTDCSAKPRTKDAQGRYTCKACFDAVKAAPAAKAAAPVKAAKPPQPEPDDAGVMAALLKDSPGTLTEMCPSCGSGMSAGAVVCTICGYNKMTGKTVSSVVQKAPSEKGEAVLGAAAAVGGAVANSEVTGLITGTIGALVGGAVGAAIWAAIAYNFHREFAVISWAIGGIVGACMGGLARSAGGPLTGGIAAGVALLSIVCGKYLTVSYLADNIENKVARRITVDDDMATAFLARDVAREHASKGKNYQWSNEGGMDEARSEEDFPKPVWDDAKARYGAMNDSDKSDYKTKVEGQVRAEFHAVMSEAKGEGFMAMFSPFDAIFFLLAIATAFKLGSGGG